VHLLVREQAGVQHGLQGSLGAVAGDRDSRGGLVLELPDEDDFLAPISVRALEVSGDLLFATCVTIPLP
jgi:hypothetical protein